ncbi:hypothetical protein LCGC14_2743380 [marine sediment metagenome]|uniref:Glycosyltransferase 2-like domain-containing protein n=1 Tax=marine sediment metagenome TaxID=412755 RepID=A0A0F9BVJ8_9ZZZZ
MSVLIAVPCYAGQLTTALFRSLLGIADLCAEQQIDLNFLVVEGEAAITRGRSNLAATFLRTDYQTFAMIDADILIEPDDFLKLLRLNKPIRGAAVCLKTCDHSESLNAYKDGKRVKRADMPADPFEVEFLGAAVMLIEREVIEKLSEIESLRYVDPINGPGTHIFAEQIVDKALLSEDFSLCHRAREHGFSVWVHPDVICSHFGPSYWRH